MYEVSYVLINFFNHNLVVYLEMLLNAEILVAFSICSFSSPKK